MAHSLSLSPSHSPDTTENLLKKNIQSKVIHPSILLELSVYNIHPQGNPFIPQQYTNSDLHFQKVWPNFMQARQK